MTHIYLVIHVPSKDVASACVSREIAEQHARRLFLQTGDETEIQCIELSAEFMEELPL
jgi:hypothetical protein